MTKRRTFLKTIGASTAALTGVTVSSGTSAALTDVDNATATLHDTRESNFTEFDWNCARVRVYLTNGHSISGLNDVLDSSERMLDNMVAETNHLDGYLLRGFDTNLESFEDFPLADEYVRAFGHERFGGANLWLAADGGMIGAPIGDDPSQATIANHPCGPRPYSRMETTEANQFPHAFKTPSTTTDHNGQTTTWAACHEIFHQFHTPWNQVGDYGQSSSHDLAGTNGTYVTVMTCPGCAGWTNGDCSGDSSQNPQYYSVEISACEAGAVDDCITANQSGWGETQTPYEWTPNFVPGTIEAEDFDWGGPGVAYSDSTTANKGSADYRTGQVDINPSNEHDYNIAFIPTGEWWEYTVEVPADGTYDFSARVASNNSDGGALSVTVDGTDVSGTVNVPNTGGWQSWTTVSAGSASLSAGQSVVRVTSENSWWNLNYLDVSSDAALVVNDYDGYPAWPGENDLGNWCGSGNFTSSGVVDDALRLEYDNAGWFESQVNASVSAYSTLNVRIKGADGGEETGIKVKLDGNGDLLSNLTNDSIGTEYSTVSIPLSAFSISGDASSVRFNCWQGESGTVDVDRIWFQ